MGCYFLLQRNLHDPGIKSMSLMSPALAGGFFRKLLKHKASSCPQTQETGSPRASRGESSHLHGDQVMKEGPSKVKTMLPTQSMTQGHRCVRSQCLRPLRNYVTPTQIEPCSVGPPPKEQSQSRKKEDRGNLIIKR